MTLYATHGRALHRQETGEGEARMFNKASTRGLRTAIALSAAISLVACSGPSDAPAGHTQTQADATTNIAGSKVKMRNPYQEKVLALTDLDRDLTLRRAIRDDGGSCAKIRGSRYQQDYKGMAMWVARCTGGDWAVFLAASGTVQARACKQMQQLGLPECVAGPADPIAPQTAPLWPEDSAPPPPVDSSKGQAR